MYECSHHLTIENSTFINTTGSGIYINDGVFECVIRSYNFYDNGTGISFSSRTVETNYGNKVENNTIYCKHKEQYAIVIAQHKVGIFKPASMYNNNYCNLYEKFYFKYHTYHNTFKTIKLLNLDGWKQELGLDRNSASVDFTKVDIYAEGAKIFFNDTTAEKKIDLSNGTYFDFKEREVPDQITLKPFSSIILLLK